jgi:hypothetical protein
MLKKLGKAALGILKGIAPMAATAVGGPYAGPALAIIAQTVGVPENKVEDFILSGSPSDLLKLKQADIELERWREEAGIRRDKMEFDDTANARVMIKDTGIWVQASLTILFIGGYFGIVFWIVRYGLPAEISEFAKGQIAILLGVLTAAIPLILGFWFGSSRGSKEKTQALRDAANRDTTREPYE